MTKVVHFRKEPYDIYIGRPSPWGNPFSSKPETLAKYRVSCRAEAIERYEGYVRDNPELLRQLHTLQGKRLGCWCAPKACHGDVLVKLVRELEEGTLAVPPNPDAAIWEEILEGVQDD